ncbi:MAG: VOC family protein [bacterium]|jgi:catechol 2,3-dioxygenase-like lactoylglutathione lyase family enzyme
MEPIIAKLLEQYESGRVNRRELIAGLSALVAVASGQTATAAEGEEPVFKATSLNHIALRVTDVPKSRDFYVKMLGLNKTSRDSESSSFLTFEHGFLALFKGDQPQMDHYCYSIENYDVNQAAEKLRQLGIEPQIQGQRIYFPDPDGLTVQLAATDHTP